MFDYTLTAQVSCKSAIMHYSHLPLIYKITCEPIYIIIREACADPESFARGGPTLMFRFFCVSGGDPNSTKSGLSSASQRNAISLAGR